MKKHTLMLSILVAFNLMANELPPLPTESVAKESTIEVKKEETKMKEGLSYLDVCKITTNNSKDILEADDPSKFTQNCREYYSYGDDIAFFKIEEFDLPSFLVDRDIKNGYYFKFKTNLKIPQELIRNDQVYFLSDNFYGTKEILNRKLKMSYIYSIKGTKISGNNYLLNLKGKDSVDLEYHVIFYTMYPNDTSYVNSLFQDDRKKFNEAIALALNNNLQIQEKKRGEKAIIKVEKKHIAQIEE